MKKTITCCYHCPLFVSCADGVICYHPKANIHTMDNHYFSGASELRVHPDCPLKKEPLKLKLKVDK